MNKGMRALLAVGFAVAAGVSQAEEFRLQGDYWGNITAPNGWLDSSNSFGRLPGSSDDAIARAACDVTVGSPCASVYLADVNTGNSIQANVSSFDGSGRRLYIAAGGVLSATRESQAGGLTLSGGQLTTFSMFTVGKMTVEPSDVLNPSVITTPGGARFVLLGDSDVRGTLDFRGTQGEVQNNGTLTQTGAGNIALWFGHDFRNRAGGVVDIRNDNGIAVTSPDFNQGPTPIRFLNEAGATLTKSAGSGTSVIEAPIVNAGRVSASSGQLTLAGGGTHAAGASLEAFGSGALGLQGAHTVTGAVTSSGDGSIYLGEFGKPGTMTIANGGTLTNSGRFFQSGTFTVESGGKLDQGQAGGFYAFSNLNVAAGGKVDNSGLIQLEGAFVNNGDVTVKGGASISGVGGTGSYIQQAGSTVIESAGYFGLADGQYQQDGGHTTINAGGFMMLGAYDANADSWVGGNYLQTAGTTTVNGVLDSDAVRFEGGTLDGSGTIYGDVVIDSANLGGTVTINPGNSPGLLTVDGNFMASSAILTTFNIEIGGYNAGEFDQIHVTGDAFFGDSLLNFLFINSFLPKVGDMFRWLIVDGSLAFANAPRCSVTSSSRQGIWRAATNMDRSRSLVSRAEGAVAPESPSPSPARSRCWGLASQDSV